MLTHGLIPKANHVDDWLRNYDTRAIQVLQLTRLHFSRLRSDSFSANYFHYNAGLNCRNDKHWTGYPQVNDWNHQMQDCWKRFSIFPRWVRLQSHIRVILSIATWRSDLCWLRRLPNRRMPVPLATGMVTLWLLEGVQAGIGIFQSVWGILRGPIDERLRLRDPGKGHVVSRARDIESVEGNRGMRCGWGAPRGWTGRRSVEGGVDLETAGEQEREASRHLAALGQLLLVDVSLSAELWPLRNGSADRVEFRFWRRRRPLAAAHAAGRKGRRDGRLLRE